MQSCIDRAKVEARCTVVGAARDWLGIVAPVGTPGANASRLYEAIKQVAATPDFVAAAIE
jgi:tripartite-type tricarboxylate transporter receptor subunit TctC